jgi:pimeloyl-ACP methyl ester carboxylesterase
MRNTAPNLSIGMAIAAIGMLVGSTAALAQPYSLGSTESSAQDPAARSGNIRTTDYLVPHISTVPANSGKRVELFVREKVGSRRRGNGPVVLMIAGATISAIPAFDPQFENYSWMDYLAAAGFDVFAMDHTGYGLSPRPMMDDPCNLAPSQQQLLIPKRLAQPCSPAYPFQLTTLQSDWDEIDRVVDYLRRVRNVDKVSLIGYSRGGLRAGGYAALHPDKVERLFLLAPGQYFRLSPSDPPAVVPVPGVPMAVLESAAFYDGWNTQVGCASQFTPQIRPVITSSILDFDPLGSTWGTAGVRRAPAWNSPGPGFASWGWNAALAGRVTVPTLIIRGDLDTTVTTAQIQDLLRDLAAVRQKVFIHVACASHNMQWETQHMSLLNASVEWLSHGTFAGQFNGSFAVDSAGQVRQEQ